MLFKATVTVMMKSSVLDPQGAAVERAIKSYGQVALKSVRIGKVVELLLEENDQATAEMRAEEWADKLLANPIMETYSVLVEQAK